MKSYLSVLLLILGLGQSKKCDQTPVGTLVPTSIDSTNSPFFFTIDTKGNQGKYLPGQTYVLTLETTNKSRPFVDFMITAEDPAVDNASFDLDDKIVDAGSLKTLDEDGKSRYSERCYSSVESADNSQKYRIETHWISPKQNSDTQRIRFRAMVAENREVWYEGGQLVIILEKNNATPIDSPPILPNPNCNLCSEARYEVIFKGQWSRGSHPRKYPSKPDDNGYSHMVGATHDYEYVLWQQGLKAGEGLKKLAEEADISVIEREIIDSMSVTGGTRTLIRGKRRHHPHMSEPSHSLFRVDRIHHLFSLVVAMKPSPDWFLGTSKFELCTDDGWLETSSIPLYPWDAGTMDGISYDSPKSVTQPVDNVERVAVGSFNKDSPFFQMNLNDLTPFAILEVNRLDVYPLEGVECSENVDGEEANGENAEQSPSNNESNDEPEPLAVESRPDSNNCLSEWSEWSLCSAKQGACGPGNQYRHRHLLDKWDYDNNDTNDLQVKPLGNQCESVEDSMVDSMPCYVEC